VEAHLVTYNGFSLSLATEWIENPADEEYDKQDCERKAFTRIAAKLKKAFPQLPIVILGDGLYPYEGFFAISKANDWRYIVTFKEGILKTVWRTIEKEKIAQSNNKKQEIIRKPDKSVQKSQYIWFNNLNYRGYNLNYLECNETITHSPDGKMESIEYKHFVHISDLSLNEGNIARTNQTGRLRWKIKNEGFNTLKNGGYCMKHKYSRTSYLAMKNYHQFMQMVSLINQIMVKTVQFKQNFLCVKNHKTLKSLWKDIVAVMQWVSLDSARLEAISVTRVQSCFIT
jgi:hypothetical protein